MRLLLRFFNALLPGRLEDDFDDELEFHRQNRLRKAREQGLSDAEAERVVKVRMGNTTLAKEEMRDSRLIGWLASGIQDLRHGLVLLRRDAGVSGLIVLVLALGIGGASAVFTLCKAAFLDPLPFPDARHLVTIMETTGWTPSTGEFAEIRAGSRTLQQLGFAEYVDMQITGSGEPARVFAARVSASFLPLLGVNPWLGRTFADDDNQLGRPPTVILSHSFWRAKTGGDPGIVGHTLRLDGASALVIGVLPAQFRFDYPALGIPEPVDVYVSFPIDPATRLISSSSGHGVSVSVIGRLRDGVTFAEAQADLRRIAHILTSEHPEAFPNRWHDPSRFSFVLLPLRDAIVGTQRSLLWLLLGGVGVLLLIACANTTQLLLARSLRRGREVAIRAALGASRGRLVRQFLLEGLVLALMGGAVGLLAAGWIAQIMVTLLPVQTPLFAVAHVDWRVAGFAMAASILSAILFSTLPALKGSRWRPGPSLSARLTVGEGNRWRHAMLAIEAALSVFLLCGAGLVAQNLWTLIATPIGFDPTHVLAMQLKLPAHHEDSIDHKAGVVFQQYLDNISAIPGIDSAAVVTGPPLRPARSGNVELLGVTDRSGALKSITAWNHLVSTDYFRTLRIQLLAGRTFRRGDTGPKATVAIVNQEFARQFGFGADIVGKQTDEGPNAKPITIIGMVGNARTRGLRADPFPEIYLSSLQLSWANTYLVVRSAMQAQKVLKDVKSAIESANSEQSVFGVVTMNDLIAGAEAEPKFEVFLIGAFSLLALAMSAAGMYSVVSCLVSQRTSEIAIRLALGAGRRAIVQTILGRTTLWIMAGLVCGLAVGVAATNTIRSFSSSVVQGSPWMYASVMLFFLAVSVVAIYLPVLRASRLDPSLALRSE
jgi:putative ABC transport system permease protein